MFQVQRANKLALWFEPFVKLRGPYLFHLRRDPFEKALEGSNTYWDWYIDRVYALGGMQYYALQFLSTFKEYPPSQVPGDWSLSTVEEQIKGMIPKSN
jgi:arylsulfatase